MGLLDDVRGLLTQYATGEAPGGDAPRPARRADFRASAAARR